jgi:hypothetical protein
MLIVWIVVAEETKIVIRVRRSRGENRGCHAAAEAEETEGEAAEGLANGLTREDRLVTDTMKRIRAQRGSKPHALY